jgi:hypothetical protein
VTVKTGRHAKQITWAGIARARYLNLLALLTLLAQKDIY